MRVITGSARGRRLEEPAGRDIRPTTDLVKEAAFSIVQFDVEGRQVLDLFAGTGQLGIEALSRGAAGCVFVDRSRAAAELVKLPGIRLLDSGSRRLCLCNQGEQAAVLFSALHIEAVNGPACAQRF